MKTDIQPMHRLTFEPPVINKRELFLIRVAQFADQFVG